MPMPMRCLVIGGTGSIGGALCERLAGDGVSVAFTYHQNENRARELATRLGVKGFAACDLRQSNRIRPILEELIGKLGGLDGLICAAGIPGISERKFDLELKDLEAGDIDACFEVNARGALLACQVAVNALKAAKRGNIVMMGSMDGVKTVPSPIHFATSKAALKGMVESMSKELGEHDIKVNLLIPGIVEGGASRFLTDDLRTKYLKHCSMKRFAKPAEVAEVAAWFALENTYVTGQSILMNGGL